MKKRNVLVSLLLSAAMVVASFATAFAGTTSSYPVNGDTYFYHADNYRAPVIGDDHAEGFSTASGVTYLKVGTYAFDPSIQYTNIEVDYALPADYRSNYMCGSPYADEEEFNDFYLTIGNDSAIEKQWAGPYNMTKTSSSFDDYKLLKGGLAQFWCGPTYDCYYDYYSPYYRGTRVNLDFSKIEGEQNIYLKASNNGAADIKSFRLYANVEDPEKVEAAEAASKSLEDANAAEAAAKSALDAAEKAAADAKTAYDDAKAAADAAPDDADLSAAAEQAKTVLDEANADKDSKAEALAAATEAVSVKQQESDDAEAEKLASKANRVVYQSNCSKDDWYYVNPPKDEKVEKTEDGSFYATGFNAYSSYMYVGEYNFSNGTPTIAELTYALADGAEWYPGWNDVFFVTGENPADTAARGWAAMGTLPVTGDEFNTVTLGGDSGIALDAHWPTSGKHKVWVMTGSLNNIKISSVKLTEPKETTVISAPAKKLAYTGKPINYSGAKISGSTGEVSYTYFTDKDCTERTTAANGVTAKDEEGNIVEGSAPSKIGTYYVRIAVACDDDYAQRAEITTLTITKKTQTITGVTSAKTLKAKTLKKKAVSFKISAKATAGKVSFKKYSGNSKITVSSNGTVTAKKGLKKGTYKVRVTVSAASTSLYNSAKVTKTLTVKVK